MSKSKFDVGDEVWVVCDVTGDGDRPPAYFENFERPYVLEKGVIVGRRKGPYGYVVDVGDEYTCLCQGRFLMDASASENDAHAFADNLSDEMVFRLIGLCLPVVVEWATACLDRGDMRWKRYNLAKVKAMSCRILPHMAAQLGCEVSEIHQQFPKDYGLENTGKKLKKLAKEFGL